MPASRRYETGNDRANEEHRAQHADMEERHEEEDTNKNCEDHARDRRGLHRQVPVGYHFQRLPCPLTHVGLTQVTRRNAGDLPIHGFPALPRYGQPQDIPQPGTDILQR